MTRLCGREQRDFVGNAQGVIVDDRRDARTATKGEAVGDGVVEAGRGILKNAMPKAVALGTALL